MQVTFSSKNCLKILICAHAQVKNVVKHHTSGKKGMLLCFKCLFEWIGANLGLIQPQNIK